MLDIKTTMCSCLAERKKEQGITYDQLQEVTGISKSQLSNIFCHKGHSVSLEMIQLVAEALNVTFELHEIYHPYGWD